MWNSWISFDGLKVWNVAVEFSTFADNGTRVIAVMCFREHQVSTFTFLIITGI